MQKRAQPLENRRHSGNRSHASAGCIRGDGEGEDFSEAEKDEIEKLKMGKVYSMDILYRWKATLGGFEP